MKRRDFIKTGTAASSGLLLASLSSGCSSSNDSQEDILKSKNHTTLIKHNCVDTPTTYYNALSSQERVFVDEQLPSFEITDTPHHNLEDTLFVANPGASRLSLKSLAREVSDDAEYETTTTVKTDSYTIHMYYKQIEGSYVSADSKFEHAYSHKGLTQDKDDVLSGNLPKYKLSSIVLVVPDDNNDEVKVVDNPAREIVKALLFRTASFSHFSKEDLLYSLNLFDTIFENKTQLEMMINHAGMDSWFRYKLHRDHDTTALLRKTQSLDSDGNVIHDVGDAIYTYPIRDIFADSLKSDSKVLMDYLSGDDRISPLFMPREEGISRMARWGSGLKQRASEYSGHTYKVDASALTSVGGSLELDSVDGDGLHLSVSNHYNRHMAVSYLEIDNDEKACIEGTSIEHKKTLPPRYALLGIPVSDSKANIVVPFAEGASATRVYFSSWSFVDGSHRALYYKYNGDQNDLQALKDILQEPELLTVVFELALPTVLIIWGGLHIKSNASWRTLVITKGLQFAHDIAGPIVDDSDLSASEAMNAIVGPLTTHILQGLSEIAAHILQDMVESEAEDSIPIAGTIYRALCLIADISNLTQAIYTLSTAKAIEYVDIKRYHTLKVQLKSDSDSFEFPNDLTDIDISVTYKSGVKAKNHHFNWDRSKVVSHTTDGGGSYATYELELEDQPSGGKMSIDVKLSRDSWVAAHAILETDSFTNDDVVVEVTNNLIELTGKSIYQHYAKLTNDGSTYKWNVKEDDATLASPTLNDSLLDKNRLFHISINDPIGAIGYSYKDLDSGEYRVKNVSAVLETPNKGVKSYTSTDMVQVSYSLLSHKSNEGSVIFEKKDSQTYIREININSESNDYEIDFSKNVGTFITDSVTQFGYYPAEDIIAGLDTESGVLHIINKSKELIEDINPSRYDNVKSAPATIKIDKEMDPKTQYFYNSKLLTMSPTGSIIILEETKVGQIRLRAFDKYGRVDLAYEGFNDGVFNLKDEDLSVVYLDISIEAKGYIYILKQLGGDPTNEETYVLDIYNPQGDTPNEPMVSTPGMSGGKLVVDFWRSVYTLNYETNDLGEPTVSLWIPPTA